MSFMVDCIVLGASFKLPTNPGFLIDTNVISPSLSTVYDPPS